MLLSALEVSLQTVFSVVGEYLQNEKRGPTLTKDGLNQLVKEQFPHCEKKEIRPGVYRIRIPKNETSPGYSRFDFQEIPEDLEDFEVSFEVADAYIFRLVGGEDPVIDRLPV